MYKIRRPECNVLSWHITLLQNEVNMSDILLPAIVLFLYVYIVLCIHITAIKRSSKKDGIYQEIQLRLSYVAEDVPISKISDDDFSEVLIFPNFLNLVANRVAVSNKSGNSFSKLFFYKMLNILSYFLSKSITGFLI